MTNLLDVVVAGDQALFVIAHPDDELLTCAGTLSLLSARGVRSTVLFLNDGRQGRFEISKRFLDSIGAKGEMFFGHPEAGHESLQRDRLSYFEGHINRIQPSVVITHGIYRGDHQEHENLGRLMTTVWQRYMAPRDGLLPRCRLFRVCPMPTGSDFVPDSYCDITTSIDGKLEWLSEMHRFKPKWYLEAEIHSSFSVAAGELVGCSQAELFCEDGNPSFFSKALMGRAKSSQKVA